MRIDNSKPWSMERGTTCFYLCNNGCHVLKTCGDAIENQAEAELAVATLNAFDVLIKHLASSLPVELKIKKLAGVPTKTLLEGFYVVPKAEWDALQSREVGNAN
jgi:hypothetical protein